jgi:hypothetical protein
MGCQCSQDDMLELTEAHEWEVQQLREERDALLALVERIPWPQDDQGRFCPWCDALLDFHEHEPDCPRQAALAKVHGNSSP